MESIYKSPAIRKLNLDFLLFAVHSCPAHFGCNVVDKVYALIR